jgi:hypothetical protein
MGLAFWGGGDLEAAHRAYSVCVEGLQRTGHIADVLGCSITLADIRSTQGHLGEALRTYEQALRLAANHDGTVLRGTADMYVGMSQIACEHDDLPAATQHLLRAQELGEHTWLPQNPYRWRVAMARVREAEGELGGALELLEEAQRVYMGDFSPNVRPIPALRARVLAAQGRVGEAWPGRASTACRPRTSCPICVSSSTSPWPEHCWPSTGRWAQSRPFPMRPGSCSACSRRPKPGSGPEVSSRSWCCRRSPPTPAATSLVHWRRWSVR